MIVDGGMLSNFPVWLFDCRRRSTVWPTFGLLLVEPQPQVQVGERLPTGRGEPRRAGGLFKYVKAMAHTMMEAHDRLYVEARTSRARSRSRRSGWDDRVRRHPTEGALYHSGRYAAAEFLETWDFDGYIEAFRSGKEHHRRAEVAEQIQEAAPH